MTWRYPRDGTSDQLVVGADILDEDGVILAESPRYEVHMPDESLVLSSSHGVLHDATHQVHEAMLKISEWLGCQTATIQEALTRAA